MVKCILVTGKARSGKNELANYINLRYPNLMYRQYALADGVRDTVSTLFDIPKNDVYDETNREAPTNLQITKNRSIRQLLQLIGHGMRSWVHDTIWCERLYSKFNNDIRDGKISNDSNLIITDVRYPNEVNFFSKVFGFYNVTVIKVTRDNNSTQLNTTESSHPGENQTITPDIDIFNNGSLEEFHDKIETIIKRLP